MIAIYNLRNLAMLTAILTLFCYIKLNMRGILEVTAHAEVRGHSLARVHTPREYYNPYLRAQALT
jgi:hypothetical protein